MLESSARSNPGAVSCGRALNTRYGPVREGTPGAISPMPWRFDVWYALAVVMLSCGAYADAAISDWTRDSAALSIDSWICGLRWDARSSSCRKLTVVCAEAAVTSVNCNT